VLKTVIKKITLRTWLQVATSSVLVSSVSAQIVLEKQADLDRIDIVEHLGESIPLDLNFIDDKGQEVELGDYFGNDKPVILTLGYYECPMLCDLVLNGLTSGLTGLKWSPGDKFNIVTVSIDPGEDSKLANAKKQNYLTKLNREGAENGWAFLVGEESQSRALAEAIGFKYFYDKDNDEYGHAAAVYVLTENGKISRYLYGIQLAEQDVRLALLEASEGKIGNTIDRLILYCFHYDPDAKGYVATAENIMKLGGLITMIGLALFLGIMWSKERISKNRIAEQSIDGESRVHG